MTGYQFSDGLLEKVFDAADDYYLTPPGENEFMASDMAEKDKKGRDHRWWRRTLDKMVEKGDLQRREGRHPVYGCNTWIYSTPEADDELPDN
jgi:hypothetical protein